MHAATATARSTSVPCACSFSARSMAAASNPMPIISRLASFTWCSFPACCFCTLQPSRVRFARPSRLSFFWLLRIIMANASGVLSLPAAGTPPRVPGIMPGEPLTVILKIQCLSLPAGINVEYLTFQNCCRPRAALTVAAHDSTRTHTSRSGVATILHTLGRPCLQVQVRGALSKFIFHGMAQSPGELAACLDAMRKVGAGPVCSEALPPAHVQDCTLGGWHTYICTTCLCMCVCMCV
jgi:hypothetical protein